MSYRSISYKYQQVNGLRLFYREAGDPSRETIVLLHGFPTSSHMYRNVIQALSDEFHLIAPDYPGFGYSDFPSPDQFAYTFANLAQVMDLFLEKLNLSSYTLMIQDYGAPVGFRIATAHPERLRALLVQNGNAYEEGLSDGFGPSRLFWENRTPETEAPIRELLSLESIQWQYTFGARNAEQINPDNWYLDYARISRPGNDRAQLDLLYDYQSNLALYPEWQHYLRNHQPPTLITWGIKDPFFPEPGARAYLKDLKNVEYHAYDTGHFALEEDWPDISARIRTFMRGLPAS